MLAHASGAAATQVVTGAGAAGAATGGGSMGYGGGTPKGTGAIMGVGESSIVGDVG